MVLKLCMITFMTLKCNLPWYNIWLFISWFSSIQIVNLRQAEKKFIITCVELLSTKKFVRLTTRRPNGSGIWTLFENKPQSFSCEKIYRNFVTMKQISNHL